MTKKNTETKKDKTPELTPAQKKIRLLNLLDAVLSQERINLSSDAFVTRYGEILDELNEEVRTFIEVKIDSILSGGAPTQQQAAAGQFAANEITVLKEFTAKLLARAGQKPDGTPPKAPPQSPVMAALTGNKKVQALVEEMGMNLEEMSVEERAKFVKELEDAEGKS